MEPLKSFRDLIVWQKSHQFVLGVYELISNISEEISKLLNAYIGSIERRK